jgi:rod shape-determining protein MreD
MSLLQTSHAPAPSIGAEVRAAGIYFVTGTVALLLQTTLLHGLSNGRIIPDLVLILCVYLGLHEHNIGGATGAFLLGYLLDSFSGSLVGLHAFAMTTVYLMVYLVARRLWMDNALSGVAMVFLGSLLKSVAIVVALAAYLSIDRMSIAVAQTVFAEALLAAALTPVVFGALGRAKRFAGVI